MDVREKLVELIAQKVCDTWSESCDQWLPHDCGKCYANDCHISELADHIIANGVTVQECAYWQYIDDDVDEDNNIQAYCSACHAGDKHATKMIGKVPYCWKCGRKMMLPPQEGE